MADSLREAAERVIHAWDNGHLYGRSRSLFALRAALDAPVDADRDRLVGIIREQGVGLDRAMRIADAYWAGVSTSTGDPPWPDHADMSVDER